MIRIIKAVAFLLICTGCKGSGPRDMDKYTMDYSIGKNKFRVVVAEDDGVSKVQAEKYALQRVAEVAHDHGYRYFTIDQESQVVVMRIEKSSPSRDMPTNAYYELIQSGNFSRDLLQTSETNLFNQIPGYQIEFSCQENKPSGRYHDVCDHNLCNY